ncbi:hypothetical protein [Haloplasma contractile]|uniref:Uncharacterized protein n=1 Tax=Haloplasma contractile SSD-17B TaxID=1033810 RepID=F7PZL7_9MOLU|nr:hypothetical protein [Haloplasma contractile]ERJ13299.1 hypothetical protein HLPCO_000928 [Haloplasma contractile SSD-17B]
MKIYRLKQKHKSFKIIEFIFVGIIIPILLNLILIITTESEFKYNSINNIFHIFFLVIAIFISKRYNHQIEINHQEIKMCSDFGTVKIMWDDIKKLKYEWWLNKRIILSDANGTKLYFQNNIVNYRSLYLEIYKQIRSHSKESIVDHSFVDYIDTIYNY